MRQKLELMNLYNRQSLVVQEVIRYIYTPEIKSKFQEILNDNN